MSQQTHNHVHDSVSRAYTEALRQSQEKQSTGSCCGPMCCGGSSAGVELKAQARAGFDDAAASSFGCGNPLAFAGVKPGDIVVDLGSGAGYDLLVASQIVGPNGKVIGVDMTPAMIAAAWQNVSKAGVTNVEIRKGLIEELPVENGSADWVISNCVINLSPDKPRVFREIARVLKPGGRFSISDIVAEELPAFVRENAAAYAACVAGAISEGDYLAGLRDAGLTDIEVTERRHYTTDEILAIVDETVTDPAVRAFARTLDLSSLTGKVWSAKVTGRKS